MIAMPPESTRQASRRPEILVAPAVTFLAVCGLLVVARFYEKLPIQAPPCQLRDLSGIPCLGCGGTRAMMALAEGNLLTAIRFNPAITFSAFAITGWLIWRLIVFSREGKAPSPLWTRKKVFLVILGFTVLFVANWVYLLFYLP